LKRGRIRAECDAPPSAAMATYEATMSRFEKLTLGLSVAALVVSIITAVVTGVVPAWIYKIQATSILKFNVDSDFSQESIRFKKLKGESNAVRFRKRAYMYLRNVGDAPLTIETVLIAAIDPKINNPNGVEWRQAISRVGPWRFDTQYPSLEVAFLVAR